MPDDLKKPAIWLLAALLACGTVLNLRATAEAMVELASRPENPWATAATAVALLALSAMLGTVTMKTAERNPGPACSLPDHYPRVPLAVIIGATAVVCMAWRNTAMDQELIILGIGLGGAATAFWFAACEIGREALGGRAGRTERS